MIRDFGSVEFLYLLAAMRWTLGLSVLAFVCGGIVGLVLALARVAPVAPLRWLAAGYIQLFQATPLLMLLFLVFFGLALFDLGQSAFLSVTIALTCYASAYFGEIWRGSISPCRRRNGKARRPSGSPTSNRCDMWCCRNQCASPRHRPWDSWSSW